MQPSRILPQKLDEEMKSLEPTLEEKIYGGRPDWAKPSEEGNSFPTRRTQTDIPTNGSLFGQANEQAVLTKTPIRSDRDLPGTADRLR